MKRIDRLIITEVLGPWVFGVGLFGALLFAATYLGRVTDYIASGVPFSAIIEMTLLLIPAILVKTFTMAVLLATLLGFGRLSSDSELVALRAAGASIARIVAPVIVFSFAIAVLAFGFNERVVPASTSRFMQIVDEIANSGKTAGHDPVLQSIVEHNKLKMAIAAPSVDLATQSLQNATMVAYDDTQKPSAVMFAHQLQFRGPQDWRIKGGATLINVKEPGMVFKIDDEAFPKDIQQINRSLSELLAPKEDQDSMTMAQLQAMIARHTELQDRPVEKLRDYEYWYWNKISVPLAAIIFGTLGAVLGIRNHRTGTAAGFALAVGIIFAYVTLANFMNVWAMKGMIPSWAASFAPLAVGGIASAIIMWRRNA